MASNATLVRTTEFGARPLGVRGEPLHNTHAQIRDVVRRRLGERHHRLLAEPQAYPATGRIDWYADGKPVRPAADLPPAERDALRAEVDGLLADIDRLGAQLQTAPGDDARLAGRALRLASKRPDDDAYLFRVGEQPVLICWGYDKETVGAILPPAFLPGVSAPVAASPPPMAPLAPPAAAVAAAAPARGGFPWLAALLVGLLGILLILGAAYGLRQFLPVPPDLQVTELPPEPPPPPPPAGPDPTVGLKAAIDEAHDQEGKLKASLVSLREEFQQRLALCKPPEPPPPPPASKPPQVERKPEPKPEPKPKVAEAPKPPPPPAPKAPPVTQPPPGLLPCNAETASGGQGVTRNRHYVGDKPGLVTVRYNMKTIPDQMNVYYRGRLVATTNRAVSRYGGLTFDFQPEAGDYTVVVEVVGPHHGTEWMYRLNCPA